MHFFPAYKVIYDGIIKVYAIKEKLGLSLMLTTLGSLLIVK